MVVKKAVIVVELVEESAGEPNRELEAEIRRGLEEDVGLLPWVKAVESVKVEGGEKP